MTPNELRVGNIVKKGNMEYVADYLTIKMAHNYEPVPLTSELLEKSGFTERSAKNSRQFEKDVILVEVIDLFGITIMARLNHKYLPNLLLCKVDYLHQLQNLYFALTGEELTL